MRFAFVGFLFCLSTLKVELEALSYAYTNFQAMSGHPLVGGGLRLKGARQALDLSGNISPQTSDFMNAVWHTKAQYLFFPLRATYLGLGMGLIREPEIFDSLSGTIEGSLGIELQARASKFFLELGAIAPLKKPIANEDEILKVWPSFTVGYGF